MRITLKSGDIIEDISLEEATWLLASVGKKAKKNSMFQTRPNFGGKCRICGASLPNFKYRYCSEECKMEGTKRIRRAYYKKKRTGKKKGKCYVCGKELPRSKSKYCSKACARIGSREIQRKTYWKHLHERPASQISETSETGQQKRQPGTPFHFPDSDLDSEKAL